MNRAELEQLLRECAKLETEVARIKHAEEQAALACRAVERRFVRGIELARALANWLGLNINPETWEVRE